MWQQFNYLSISKADHIKASVSFAQKQRKTKHEKWKEKASSGHAVDCFYQKNRSHFISRLACSVTIQNMHVHYVCIPSVKALRRESHVLSKIRSLLLGRVHATQAAKQQEFPGWEEIVRVSIPSCKNCLSQHLA